MHRLSFLSIISLAAVQTTLWEASAWPLINQYDLSQLFLHIWENSDTREASVSTSAPYMENNGLGPLDTIPRVVSPYKKGDIVIQSKKRQKQNKKSTF